MHLLVRKEEKWRWGEEQKVAFRRLKEVFTIELVIAIPGLDKEMRVEADTSDYTTGEVLSVKCGDEKWRPVAFISKSLNATKQNYKIHDKEMLAVIQCLESWKYYLEGAKVKFEI